MFKKELGISVYPEKCNENELEKYLIKCWNKKITKVFISLFHFTDEATLILYKKAIVKMKEIGFYIVADINENIKKLFGDDFVDKLGDLKIDCLRLDSPMMPMEVASWTFNKKNFDIQVNASNNDNFINNVLDFQPLKEKLFACHNFYPQVSTGLPESFFLEASKKFIDLGLSTSAFVGSQYGEHGPQKFKVGPLVSMETLRNLPIRSQTKLLFATQLIDTVYVGNFPMEDKEIDDFSDVLNLKKIELDVNVNYEFNDLENKIVNFSNHFRRGDINENFIRSTMMRPLYINDLLEPNNTKSVLNRGDVCIVNKNNKNYNSELFIILKDNYKELGNTVNVIGRIKEYDYDLLKYVKPWSKFQFKIIK